MKINSKNKEWEGDNDDSFVSYTEMKLDQLYKESKHLLRQTKILDEKCLRETDPTILGLNHEIRTRKLHDLEKNSRF